MADFVQTLITTIEVGSLYGLIALGYTMVYGILQFINFAHSDIVVLGAWVSYTLAAKVLPRMGVDPRSFLVGGGILIAAMLFCGLVGFVIQRFAYKPLRRAPRLNVLITAIGVSLFLQNVGQLKFGSSPIPFGPYPRPTPVLLPDTVLVSWAGVNINLVNVAVVGTALLLMLAL